MRELTQTNTDPGNCWQTAIACVLDLEVEDVPNQVQIQAEKKHYSNFLNAFLLKHYGVFYSEIPNYQIGGLNPPPGHYFYVGPTIRSPNNGGVHHVVVAHGRRMVWDPHPSRAGLAQIDKWGILAPYPAELKTHWEMRAKESPDTWGDLICKCRSCK